MVAAKVRHALMQDLVGLVVSCGKGPCQSDERPLMKPARVVLLSMEKGLHSVPADSSQHVSSLASSSKAIHELFRMVSATV